MDLLPRLVRTAHIGVALGAGGSGGFGPRLAPMIARQHLLSLALAGVLALACGDAPIASENDEREGAQEQSGLRCVCKRLVSAGADAAEGDVVCQLEGADMSTPEVALEAYARLRECSQPTPVTRDGQPATIEYPIE